MLVDDAAFVHRSGIDMTIVVTEGPGMHWRSRTALLLIAAATWFAGSAAEATVRGNEPLCGFGKGDDRAAHVVTYRKHVSCAAALRILRDLKGGRSLVPMACGAGHDRTVRGWKLRSIAFSFPDIQTHFEKRNVEINYLRETTTGAGCPTPPAFHSDGPS
ncbi:MAG: hypothetical protein AAGC46_21235 [Solirubrobacteraceae bacterium]